MQRHQQHLPTNLLLNFLHLQKWQRTRRQKQAPARPSSAIKHRRLIQARSRPPLPMCRRRRRRRCLAEVGVRGPRGTLRLQQAAVATLGHPKSQVDNSVPLSFCHASQLLISGSSIPGFVPFCISSLAVCCSNTSASIVEAASRVVEGRESCAPEAGISSGDRAPFFNSLHPNEEKK